MTQKDQTRELVGDTEFSFADMVEVANDIFIVTKADLGAP